MKLNHRDIRQKEMGYEVAEAKYKMEIYEF